jgi:hypothetical protein
MKTTRNINTGRTLHSFLCEALGCEDQDLTRPFAPASTRTAEEEMAALNAIEIDLSPKRKRR